MAITVQYGTFSFATGEPEVRTSESYEFQASGARERRNVSITISGKIQGSTSLACAQTADAMRTALAVDDQNFLVYSGTTLVNHLSYAGTSCIRGPKITGMSFPEATGPELADGGVRTYSITMEASVELAGSDANGTVVSYRQSITVGGGRPVYQVLETLDGTAEVWTTSGTSAYRATQSGEAIGRSTWPAAAAPLWPSFEIIRQPARYDSPEFVILNSSGTATTARFYRTTWDYEFAAGSDVFTAEKPDNWYVG